MRKIILFVGVISLLGAFILMSACGSATQPTAENPVQGKVIKTGSVNNLTATLATASGVIKNGANDFTLSFTDASGKPVDVGAASVNFHMPAMGTMAVMNDAATLTTSGTPGVYNGKVKLSMSGEWQVQIAFEGAAGTGKTSFPIMAQ